MSPETETGTKNLARNRCSQVERFSETELSTPAETGTKNLARNRCSQVERFSETELSTPAETGTYNPRRATVRRSRSGFAPPLGDLYMARHRPAISILLVLASCTLGHAAPPPNVVFILGDDVGWRDLGCYGSTYHKTPNLDALAGRGMRFTQAYSANPLCSPTRSSILTGLYPARIGITTPSCHVKQEILDKSLQAKAPPSAKALQAVSLTRLKQEYFTLAEALKEAGYATGHFGKWHLGPEPYDPLHQGFDVDFPHWPGPGPAGSYLAPWKFPETLLVGRPGEHIEDRVSAEVVKFIRANKDRPFYVNYWCFSVHSPWDAKPELVEKYRRTADPNNPQRNPVYAAMIHSMDEGVGRVVRAIDELGLAERTIFVYFADNGGVDWHEPKMQQAFGMQDPPTSNLPLRGGKATMHEGGTREPCIVVWPGVTRPGATSDALVQSLDFYPTLLDMLGLKPHPGVKFDGQSFAGVLKGQPGTRDTVFCHFPHTGHDRLGPATYVRKGDWKLIRRYCDSADQTDTFELYNLRDDLAESQNLAEQKPDKVRELNALIDAFLAHTEALVPKPNPDYVAPGRWTAGKDAQVEFRDGLAIVRSQKDRPTLQVSLPPQPAGDFVVKFRARVSKGQGGLVLWGTNREPGFAPTRRQPVPSKFDGQWHDYEVRFTTPDTLQQLRVDVSLAPTTVEFDWIRLERAPGATIQAWEF